MNIFDLIFTQPVFNLLLFLYEVLPWRDLGIAIILFTVIIRLIMWPLVRKQLHQGRLMRKLQPQLAEIRKKTKNDKAAQGRLTMELYKEKGVNPFSSIGLLLVQLPIFIALYSAVRIITSSRNEIPQFTYGFMESVPGVTALLENPQKLDATFIGLIDLTESALSSPGLAAVLLVLIALTTAGLQFLQTKQLMPEPQDKKRLRDLLKAQAKGVEVDQADVMQAATRRMMYIIPIVIFFVTVTITGALALYIFASVAVGYIQQKIILREDEEEMEEIAEEPVKQQPAKPKPKSNQTRAQRAKSAQTAEVAAGPNQGKKSKKKKPHKGGRRHG